MIWNYHLGMKIVFPVLKAFGQLTDKRFHVFLQCDCSQSSVSRRPSRLEWKPNGAETEVSPEMTSRT